MVCMAMEETDAAVAQLVWSLDFDQHTQYMSKPQSTTKLGIVS